LAAIRHGSIGSCEEQVGRPWWRPHGI